MALALLAGPARAAVVAASPDDFSIAITRTVRQPPAAAWAVLVQPAGWWSPAHSWSGDARNLRLDARAGGCFCETWGQGASVEHARVVHVDPGKLLRLTGALGPLQRLPVTGVLSFGLAPVAGGTAITLTYVVAGRAPGLGDDAAPVDKVLGEQADRLARRIDTGAP